MSLRRLARDTRPLKVSFEFSPPKTAEAEENLWRCIRRLEPLQPDFVSVTYGAGGSTRDRTHNTVKRIVEETKLAPAAHLTCVAHTKSEIEEIVRGYWDAGIRHIVALRGDMPGMVETPSGASRRLCRHARPDRGHSRDCTVRDQRVRLSRAPSGFRVGSAGHRAAESEGRRPGATLAR